MDLRQLRSFVAVYEEGSFSKAAAREHCTQPGLSLQIKQLEQSLGHRLFERNARGVTPTIAGKHFYASCTEVLGAVKAAKQSMLDLSGSVAGSINLGVPPSFSSAALPAVLRRYGAEFPYVEIRIAEAYSGTLSEWVVAGDLDLAIVTQPAADLGLETTKFFRDRLVLVGAGTAGENGIATRPARNERSAVKLAIPSPRHSLRKRIDEHLRFGSLDVSRIVEIDGLTGTLALVRSSDWFTILPVCAVLEEIEQGRLAAWRLPGPDLWLDYFLVQTKELPLSVAVRRFLGMLKGELEGLSARWAVLGRPKRWGRRRARHVWRTGPAGAPRAAPPLHRSR